MTNFSTCTSVILTRTFQRYIKTAGSHLNDHSTRPLLNLGRARGSSNSTEFLSPAQTPSKVTVFSRPKGQFSSHHSAENASQVMTAHS